jgi:predicted RNase H-like nuclease
MTLQTEFLPGIYIGIDGCSCGWFAIRYGEDSYQDSRRFDSIVELWNIWSTSAETVLVDIPIGLWESSSEPRPCDTAARAKLGQPRQSSVFPTPIREAVHADSY